MSQLRVSNRRFSCGIRWDLCGFFLLTPFASLTEELGIELLHSVLKRCSRRQGHHVFASQHVLHATHRWGLRRSNFLLLEAIR
jgi:hypothetical protein